MDSFFLPPEFIAWLMRYGLALVACLAGAAVLALAARPVVLWYTGRSEQLERLKRIDENTRKALMELEMLNETLSIPVKKAAQRAQAAERPQEPLVVSQETKEGFLQALQKTRESLRPEQPTTLESKEN